MKVFAWARCALKRAGLEPANILAAYSRGLPFRDHCSRRATVPADASMRCAARDIPLRYPVSVFSSRDVPARNGTALQPVLPGWTRFRIFAIRKYPVNC
ncbi:hypothetical protein [Burkholderia latens]|uniref:hypothetical protein n=1 Tax=Burkholderia latens TaxID=488446 RepID=UPI000AE63CD2|nr:hypothetical protein [Burkholderia latens]MBY4694740.1 hypothetical protein [Burkholderia latens]